MFKTFFYCCVFFCFLPDTLIAGEPLRISVSVPPQQYLVERIGNEFVDVQVILKPGDSPETFDPSAKQISKLNSTQLYFRIGVAFEKKWITLLKKNNTQIKVIDCCEDIIGNHSLSLDNHVWTSARNLQLIAAIVKNELIKADPLHTLEFEQNYLDLIVELEQLDNEIYALLNQRRTDYFIISHAALGHFANDYGLIQMSLENEGKELGAHSLVNIVRQARLEKIRTLFVQKQHSSATALAFANEIGAQLIEVDLLDSDYLTNLRSITK
jgi:zinc transport system substrate-binding protein